MTSTPTAEGPNVQNVPKPFHVTIHVPPTLAKKTFNRLQKKFKFVFLMILINKQAFNKSEGSTAVLV